MVEPNAHVLAALMSWHGDQLERGVGPDKLPNVADLRTIAATPGVNRQMLHELPLVDEANLMPYATGVMTAVRTALRELAAAEAQAAAAPPPPPPPSPPPASPPPGAAQAPARRRRTTSSSRTSSSGSAPTAAPAAATAPDAAPPQTLDRPAASAPSASFAPYDLTTPRPPVVLPISVKPQPDGRLWVGWQPPPQPAPYVLYRVVSRDDVMPWTPDEADLIGITTEVEVYDARPLPSALRHVQVWAYAGADETSARGAQPVLLREGTVIAPPAGLEWMEDHGTVVISWRRVPGVPEVELRRIPVEEVATDVFSPSHVLLRDGHSTSYQDTSCQPGQHYEYRLYSVVAGPSGEAMSEPARFRVQISSSLAPVTELRLSERTDNGRTLVDLEWNQPPNADVRIYRTKEPPDISARLTELDVSALPATGLSDADRQRLPPSVEGGIGRMTGVTWPDDISRVHFTAVTVSGTTARVGDTATRSRTTAITDVRLVQRVSWQHLTFSWPLGAVSVDVHITPPGTTLAEYPRPPVRTLLEAEYRRDGGTRLQLPWSGCEVHLVPVSFYDRRPVKGEPTAISYDGLLALRYHLAGNPPPPPAGRFGGQAPAPPSSLRTIRVQRIDSGGEGGPTTVPVVFTLVVHSQRLPLSAHDAETTLGAVTLNVPTDGVAELQVGEQIDLSTLAGQYLRLFARVEGDSRLDVALLDPPLEMLRLR